MHWMEVLTIVFANVGLFLWLRSESNADRRQFQAEIKDFHGRLCAIEERYQVKRHQNHN